MCVVMSHICTWLLRIIFWSKLLQIASCIKDFNIWLFHNQHADNSYLLSEKKHQQVGVGIKIYLSLCHSRCDNWDVGTFSWFCSIKFSSCSSFYDGNIWDDTNILFTFAGIARKFRTEFNTETWFINEYLNIESSFFERYSLITTTVCIQIK